MQDNTLWCRPKTKVGIVRDEPMCDGVLTSCVRIFYSVSSISSMHVTSSPSDYRCCSKRMSLFFTIPEMCERSRPAPPPRARGRGGPRYR